VPQLLQDALEGCAHGQRVLEEQDHRADREAPGEVEPGGRPEHERRPRGEAHRRRGEPLGPGHAREEQQAEQAEHRPQPDVDGEDGGDHPDQQQAPDDVQQERHGEVGDRDDVAVHPLDHLPGGAPPVEAQIQAQRVRGDVLAQPVRAVPGQPARQPCRQRGGRLGGHAQPEVAEGEQRQVVGGRAGDRVVDEPQGQLRGEQRRTGHRQQGRGQGRRLPARGAQAAHDEAVGRLHACRCG